MVAKYIVKINEAFDPPEVWRELSRPFISFDACYDWLMVQIKDEQSANLYQIVKRSHNDPNTDTIEGVY
jgi:hypothetical protein